MGTAPRDAQITPHGEGRPWILPLGLTHRTCPAPAGGSGSSDERGRHSLTKAMAHRLMYLGKADGVTVLFGRPASSVAEVA
jgi:hypothetical protein